MDSRGAIIGMPAPGLFHCIACRANVIGTPSGHCPRCGYVPPMALVGIPEPITTLRATTLGLVVMLILSLVAVARA